LFSLHNAKRAKDEFLSVLTLLPVVLLILFVFPYLLLFNEIEIKQNPISFRSAASARHNLAICPAAGHGLK